MADASKKMLQRSQLVSILNQYRNVSKIDNKKLKSDIDIISTFDDKTFVFKTLLTEIISSNGIYCDICSIIAFEAFDDELFEKLSASLLKDNKISNDKKFLIISLMRQKGIDFNFRDIAGFVDNPEEIAHTGVEDFLNNALYDPEVQLDLLDFFVNIPKDEKMYFLENLEYEFNGDDLANAFSLLIQLNLDTEEFEFVLNALLNIDSCYALSGLRNVFANKQVETKSKTKIRRVIKKLENKYSDFSLDYLTKESKVYKTLIGFVDGKSNFSMVFSRKRANGLIDTLLMGINLTMGLTSCMGFCAIPEENFDSVVKRLFSDSVPVNISPIALKTLYMHYIDKSFANNIELPYELIVWQNMLNDVRAINYDISEFINSKLERLKLTKLSVKKFVSAKITETWYYSYGDNKFVDQIIDKIEKQHCLDLDIINKWVDETIDNSFLVDKVFMSKLQSKLLLQAYIASLSKLKLTSACAYSLCFKSQYTKMLIESMIDKSIYYALSTKLYQLEEENIFKKEPLTKFSKDELEILMAQLEEKWA